MDTQSDNNTPQQIRQILYSQLISQAIQTFCVLNLPDLIDTSNSSIEQLANQTQTNPAALARLLRALTQFGLVTNTDGEFALTLLGKSLTRQAVASAQPTALLINGEIGQAWRGITETIRSGKSSFEEFYHATLFKYLEANPEKRAIFDRSQDMGLELEVPELLDHLVIGESETILDIGGGSGYLLTRILEKWPNNQGILLDLPVATEIARKKLAEQGKTGLFQIIAGDFFKALPENASIYLLSHVLHDWSDDNCRKILSTCHRNMPKKAILIIIDLLASDIEDTNANKTAAMMDLYMLSLFGISGGKERTEKEFRELLGQANFTVKEITQLPSGNGIIYATPK
ncbi:MULTISPECIES: methyltransferase [Xenorhabdus]|uniref:Phenazine-specific methyltransferase PhzM n=1 Tax=Xenorhabdus ehlersii TaxID=290111 RepID=A0A2D0IUT0_9GAMM|nr:MULTISPECIES: methyltransferase [Xenorhabdus]MBC8950429.1 phenazine-specific methyltransferase PhzM [Xenorhabdus sp. TS4]PHM25652.1 phenazine-specific methyltransferase PhzM [Xenorhabdus ehlersii]RKE93479.1 ubiquinone/menaquinone biosynthesis C-methylase UbiE [Xenorhabdus ehlersii]